MAQAVGVVWVVERVARDLDEIVADYIDDALLITPAARCAARTAPGRHSPDYSPICPALSGMCQPRSSRVTCCSLSGTRIGLDSCHGRIDTFVFTDDKIRVQTVRYTLEKAD
jgi:hypothetical protein